MDRIARRLDARSWRHVGRRVVAMGWDFGVRTDAVDLGEHLDLLLGAVAVDGEPQHWYSLLADRHPTYVRHRLYRDGTRLLAGPIATRMVDHLLWDINQQVSRSTADKILVHAGCVARRERALILTAPSEAGKTTLTAGLIERGFDYLSDEAVGIDPSTLLVHAYPKPLAIEAGSQPLFPALAPLVESRRDAHGGATWHVPASWLGADAVTSPIAPAWIVVPQYVRGAPTRLVDASRAETLAVLMEQELNLHRFGQTGFRVLAELTRRCRCFRLQVGSLDEACDALVAVCDAGGIDG